jgi:RNA polymerase sigma-70 factor (ECF subfamily)
LLSFRFTRSTTAAEVAIPESTRSQVAVLTRCLAAGDEAAFRQFHAQYFDRLYQFQLVLARGHEHEAQEALQETLLRVVRYVRVFEREEVFWSWLKTVARSAARDAGRKQQRYCNLLERFACFWRNSSGPPAGPEPDVLRSILDESLDELPPADRRLLEAKYLDGAAVKELSAETGLTDKAVESRLLRLRRQLRERLLKKLHEP